MSPQLTHRDRHTTFATATKRTATSASVPAHHLDRHPAFRAIISAAPPLAVLTPRLTRGAALISTLALACSDLTEGFAAPPQSARRKLCHRRAWTAVREIDRAISPARIDPPDLPDHLLKRARRAIDRADVMIGTLCDDEPTHLR